ncbi:MAG: hypothetical protein ABWZ40_02720 [Caulobacterales bacterium]
MITGTEERRLQRELRYYCIMGSQQRPIAGQTTQTPPATAPAPEVLVNSGLVDPTGAITPKGHDFMRA